MKKSSFSASLECARRLVEAGCPLDYLEDLPHRSLRRIYVESLEGYATSRLIDLGDGGVRYILALRLGTDLAGGATVTDWSISVPWDQHVTWDMEPREIVPKADWPSYSDLFDSRLLSILNGRGRVYAGRPVAGLACGQAYFQSVPKSVANGSIRIAELKLSSGAGYTITSHIELRFERWLMPKPTQATRRGPLFEKPVCEPVAERHGVPSAADTKQPPAVTEDKFRCEGIEERTPSS
jgi:hypothetical protein